MSLFAEYFEERVPGGHVIETGRGFVAFRLAGEEVSVDELFVRKCDRKSIHGVRLLDQVVAFAKQAGCKRMTCAISPAANGSTEAMFQAIRYGFRLHSTGAHEVLLSKEI